MAEHAHLKSVTAPNEHQSHWIANVPPPFRLEWDAEITDDQENRKISWRSLPGSSIHHIGSVLFHAVPGRNVTEIKLMISCTAAGGSIGGAVAKLLAMLTEQQIREELRAFKAAAETGENLRSPASLAVLAERSPKANDPKSSFSYASKVALFGAAAGPRFMQCGSIGVWTSS